MNNQIKMKITDPEIKNNPEAMMKMTIVKLYEFKHYLTPKHITHITKVLYMKEALPHFIYISIYKC